MADGIAASIPAGMGFGDVLMHGPALEALVVEHVTVEHHYADLARRLALAPSVEGGPTTHWGSVYSRDMLVLDPLTPRAELFARAGGVDPSSLKPFTRVNAAVSGDYIAIFPAAYEGRRSLSCGREVADRINALGISTHLIGRDGLPSLASVVDEIATARAVIAVDSGPMHIAAVLGVPLVACFTHVWPQSRLTWMGDGTRITLTPPGWGTPPLAPGELDPQPRGNSYDPEAIVAALECVLEAACV